jgi:hypothetical protein
MLALALSMAVFADNKAKAGAGKKQQAKSGPSTERQSGKVWPKKTLSSSDKDLILKREPVREKQTPGVK